MRVWRFEHAKRQSNSSINSAAGASRSANTMYQRSLRGMRSRSKASDETLCPGLSLFVTDLDGT
jgi:hypothetical protein